MLSRQIKLSLILLVVIGMIAVAATLVYMQVRDLGPGAVAVLLGNVVLQTIGTYLLVFLAILVTRYLFMMLYSYFEHIEYLEGLKKQKEQFEKTGKEDDFLPMISLVVPAYNEGPLIQPAVRSLLELDYPNYEVLVIDDGSSDDTYEKAMEVALESTHVAVRVITKKNGGKSDALNTGMTYARGEFILNMDGDSKLTPNTLRACVRHFKDPRVGAVAGNVKVLNRENTLTRIQALEYVEGLAMARKAQSYFRAVNIIPGPLGMFRKIVLQQVGGYDHDTFAEDCDLTLKVLMLGWHIQYEPSAIAWVETPSALINLLKQRYRWTRGILQATRKHRWAMWQPRKAGINSFILWYMLFEGIMWPFSTVFGNLFFAYIGIQYGVVNLLFFWWLQLTMLDVVAAAFCIVVEEEDPILIPYAVLFRLYYICIVDVAKVFATIEEWRGTAMTWGKLQREGKL